MQLLASSASVTQPPQFEKVHQKMENNLKYVSRQNPEDMQIPYKESTPENGAKYFLEENLELRETNICSRHFGRRKRRAAHFFEPKIAHFFQILSKAKAQTGYNCKHGSQETCRQTGRESEASCQTDFRQES